MLPRHQPRFGKAQIVGLLTQASSCMLNEEITFSDQPSTGAGEEAMGAVASAIANPVFNAIGMRVRQFPLTPERIKAALYA